jgi:hypothetical protein
MSDSQDTSQSNSPQSPDWHVRLYDVLDNYFDDNDIRKLCFDLRVDYQDLAGTSKAARVIELIKYFARSGKIGELIDHCSQIRPNVSWSDLRAAAINNPLIVDKPDKGLEHGASSHPPTGQPAPDGPKPPRLKVMVTVAVVVALMGVVGLILAITLSDCKLNNLLKCSRPLPIYIDGQSSSTVTLTSDNLIADFNNNPQNTTAVVFQFASPLDVKGFNYLEIKGTSTQPFDFGVEYKVLKEKQPTIVTTSRPQQFPSTSKTFSIKVPITYDGSINELGLNFFGKGQSSRFVIESIRLIQ